jgi:hypothetical protein
MPNYYFDSSALVKYYHEELGSPEVIRLIQTPDVAASEGVTIFNPIKSEGEG